MNRYLIILLLTILFSVPGCATRLDQQLVPLEQLAMVEQFKIEEDAGRIHFFLGKFFMNQSRGFDINEAGEVYINNTKAGTIGNSKEYIVIDLFPGNYSFKWVPISSGSENCFHQELTITVKKDDLIFLKANMAQTDSNQALSLFGAIGGVIEASKMKIISYLERDNSIKYNIKAYKLVSLNKELKKSIRTE